MQADNLNEYLASMCIAATKQWLKDIIIGLNFCPFAKKEFVNDRIHYFVSPASSLEEALLELNEEFELLAGNDSLETSLLIYPLSFADFELYLDFVELANDALVNWGYEGEFQLATFHPNYCFDGEEVSDPANYTNRSPYPTLHIIRETSLSKVLELYSDPESIPLNNMQLAREKGADYFSKLLASYHKAND